MDKRLNHQLDNFAAAIKHRDAKIRTEARCMSIGYSDTVTCRCGLAWDLNDPDPPICPATQKPAPAQGANHRA